MILNENINQYDDLEEKEERGIKVLINLVKSKLFERENYKKLWEEQNIELDKQKLKNHRKDREIKKLQIKIEKLENELSDLKAHTPSKKSK